MSSPVEAIAYHGWGYDHTCWQPWKERLASCQIDLLTFDRGYFGTAQSPGFMGDRRGILLTHSYGLHLCPKAQFQRVDLLVIFSSFIDFHPKNEQERRRSKRILRQMINESQKDPLAVLKSFKIRCEDPDVETPFMPDRLDQPLLTSDLENLNCSCLNLQDLDKIPQILILQGTVDKIVPVNQAKDLFEALKQTAHYFEIPDAGHALPFSHTSDCWDLIYPFLTRYPFV